MIWGNRDILNLVRPILEKSLRKNEVALLKDYIEFVEKYKGGELYEINNRRMVSAYFVL